MLIAMARRRQSSTPAVTVGAGLSAGTISEPACEFSAQMNAIRLDFGVSRSL